MFKPSTLRIYHSLRQIVQQIFCLQLWFRLLQTGLVAPFGQCFPEFRFEDVAEVVCVVETAECGDRVEGVGCGGEQDLHSFQPVTYNLLVNGVPGHFF